VLHFLLGGMSFISRIYGSLRSVLVISSVVQDKSTERGGGESVV
jgi:hypothetical protein